MRRPLTRRADAATSPRWRGARYGDCVVVRAGGARRRTFLTKLHRAARALPLRAKKQRERHASPRASGERSAPSSGPGEGRTENRAGRHTLLNAEAPHPPRRRGDLSPLARGEVRRLRCCSRGGGEATDVSDETSPGSARLAPSREKTKRTPCLSPRERGEVGPVFGAG